MEVTELNVEYIDDSAYRSMYDLFDVPCIEPDVDEHDLEHLIEQEFAAYEASCPAHVEAARAADHRAHVTEWLYSDIPF